jgi:2-oxoglutarate dehydrogenase E2 component (dihydrolipoamide succinyltransferase)
MSDVTPKAQELADEKGIDISTVEGSGKDGRVLVEDVEKVLEEREAAAKAEEASQEQPRHLWRQKILPRMLRLLERLEATL